MIQDRNTNFNIEQLIARRPFDAGNPVTQDILAPTNALALGSIQRTNTGTGKTATVKAGEDIRPALNSLKSAGGGTLILLAGIHKPTYDIVGDSKINIVGEGVGKTIIDFGGGAYGVTFIGTASVLTENFSLKDLTIQNSNNTAGIEINYANYWNIDNVLVTSCDQIGISVTGAKYFRMENISATSNTGDGFYITGESSFNSRYFLISNFLSESNGGNGFNFFSNNTTGAVDRFTLTGARAISNTGDGFVFSGNSSFTGKVIDCYTSGNTDGFDISNSGLIFFGCETSAGSTETNGFNISGNATVVLIGCSAKTNSGTDFNIGSSCNVTMIGCSNSASSTPSNSFNSNADIHSIGNAYQFSPDVIDGFYSIQTGTVTSGDVVIYDNDSSGKNVTTTTTQGDDLVCGVCVSGIASGGVNYRTIRTEGLVTTLKVDGTTDIAVGDFLCTSTTAGIAQKATTGDMCIAIALEAYTTDDQNGVIDALIISPRKL